MGPLYCCLLFSRCVLIPQLQQPLRWFFQTLLIHPQMTLQNSKARFQISQNSQVKQLLTYTTVIGKNYRTLQPDQIQFGLIAITRELINQA